MALLKSIHVLAVILSASGFVARGLWSFCEPNWRGSRWVRIVPHGIDTVLLFSGIAMAALYRWSPVEQPWLMTKLVLLLVYILLGMVALRWGASMRTRAIAWALALATLGYIVAVALTKDPIAGVMAS